MLAATADILSLGRIRSGNGVVNPRSKELDPRRERGAADLAKLPLRVPRTIPGAGQGDSPEANSRRHRPSAA